MGTGGAPLLLLASVLLTCSNFAACVVIGGVDVTVETSVELVTDRAATGDGGNVWGPFCDLEVGTFRDLQVLGE